MKSLLPRLVRVLLLIVFLLMTKSTLFAYTIASSLDYPLPKDKYIHGSHECRKFLTPANHLGDDINPFGSCPRPKNKQVYKQFDGFPVAAIGDGRIVKYGAASGYGQLVAVVEHDLGEEKSFINGRGGTTNTRYILSIYGHIRKNKVRGDGTPLPWRVGDEIRKGDVLGYINKSSYPDGTDPDPNGDGYEHLHFGIRLDSKKTAVAKDASWFRGYDEQDAQTGRWKYRKDFADPSKVIESFLFDGAIERVSISSTGELANDTSFDPALSSDGRVVAFSSYATNLVEGNINPNGELLVFVRDRLNKITEVASISSYGEPANEHCYYPSISGDGRFVVFYSRASNLVDGVEGGVFLHDRETGQTEVVSILNTGEIVAGYTWRPHSVSFDGRYVVLDNYNGVLYCDDILIRDRITDQTELASISSEGAQGNGDNSLESISTDGNYVVFCSSVDELVSSDTNGVADIVVRDRITGQTELASISSGGAQGNNGSWASAISSNGRYVAFDSAANNLVSGDTNGDGDIFIHDRVTGETELVSASSLGVQGNNGSWFPGISGNGRYVVFYSWSTNLVPNDTNDMCDMFVHDRITRQTRRVNVSPTGAEANCSWPLVFGISCDTLSISEDGKFIAFPSCADNLLPGKSDAFDHVYVVRNPLAQE